MSGKTDKALRRVQRAIDADRIERLLLVMHACSAEAQLLAAHGVSMTTLSRNGRMLRLLRKLGTEAATELLTLTGDVDVHADQEPPTKSAPDVPRLWRG